ncbi:MAG: LarC family nickel insertion protein, partial [Candidatus Aminicenantes bacterium]
MKYIYFDGSSGMSGDMILGALLDLGVSSSLFKNKMAELELPVEIQIKETKRSSLRGLKVDVKVKSKEISPRKWHDIETLIAKSPFSDSVKKNALAIFKRLFEAESHVHAKKFHQAHLHEAGADDAIIDIVGCCFLTEVLKIKEFYASPLNLGQGWVKTSHGILSVPPPAVAELLKNIPVYSAWVKEELVTPTGAAIVSTLVNKFIPLPEICYEKIGCGAGSRNFPDFPNILRIFYGNLNDFKADKKIYLI